MTQTPKDAVRDAVSDADKVVDAILAGATAVAGTETAKRLNALSLPFDVRPVSYIREGVLYAVDLTSSGPLDLPLV